MSDVSGCITSNISADILIVSVHSSSLCTVTETFGIYAKTFQGVCQCHRIKSKQKCVLRFELVMSYDVCAFMHVNDNEPHQQENGTLICRIDYKQHLTS